MQQCNGMEEISSSSPTLFLSYSLTMTIVTIPNLSRWFINKTSSTATSRYFFFARFVPVTLWPALDFVSWKFIQFILYIKLKVSGHTQQKSDVTSQTLFFFSFIHWIFNSANASREFIILAYISNYCWLSTHYFSNSTKKSIKSQAGSSVGERRSERVSRHSDFELFACNLRQVWREIQILCDVLRKIQWLLNSCVSGWDGPMLSWVWLMGNWWFSIIPEEISDSHGHSSWMSCVMYAQSRWWSSK